MVFGVIIYIYLLNSIVSKAMKQKGSALALETISINGLMAIWCLTVVLAMVTL